MIGVQVKDLNGLWKDQVGHKLKSIIHQLDCHLDSFFPSAIRRVVVECSHLFICYSIGWSFLLMQVRLAQTRTLKGSGQYRNNAQSRESAIHDANSLSA